MHPAGSATRPRLHIAPDPEIVPSNHSQREKIADYLQAIIDMCRAHTTWTTNGIGHDPPVAALIVLVDAHGEPTPLFVGDAWRGNYRHDTPLWDLVLDVTRAITDTTIGGHGFQELTDRWQTTEARRAQHRAQTTADATEHARTHPFLCTCGKRCKSQSGLTRHQTGCYHHNQPLTHTDP